MNTKILIVDDEIDIVLMLRSFFESKGYLVLFATNGEEALKQIERQPNIILLDINMPGLDGLEVCERIRNYISCPILFLTARIEDTDKVRGFAAGGDDYDFVHCLSFACGSRVMTYCFERQHPAI